MNNNNIINILRTDIENAQKVIPSELFPIYIDRFVREYPVSSVMILHNISRKTANDSIETIEQIMQRELFKYKDLLHKPLQNAA